ncbi:MAG: hypothetical protein HY908_19805 [Myxococcales bacterium]|nr:hypothetical protein [Myxococcales bacterium]
MKPRTRPATGLLALAGLLGVLSCGPSRRTGGGEVTGSAEVAPGGPRGSAPEAAAPMLIVQVLGPGGTWRIHGVVPEQGATLRPLAGTQGAEVRAAVVSSGATALAMLVTGESGGPGLHRLVLPADRLSAAPEAARVGAGHPVALSDDGTTVVFDTVGELAVLRLRGDAVERRTVDTRALGERLYGVALSGDGRRLAFSTARADCGRGEVLARCPITLWGLELGEGKPEPPHAIAAPADAVAYDPQLAAPRGDTVLFMTSADDTREACRAHVMACRYALRRAPFAGGASVLVADDAILGRLAPDGTLAFVRPGPPQANGHRAWGDSTLFVRPLVGGAVEVGPAEPRVPQWSPDGRSVAVATLDGVFVHTADGRRLAGPLGTKGTRPVGWLRAPVATAEPAPF